MSSYDAISTYDRLVADPLHSYFSVVSRMDADAAIASLEYTISQINKHVKRESTNGARFKTQVSAFSRFVDTSHFFVWPDDKIIDIAWGHVKTAIDCIVIYETLNHTIAWFPRHSNIWSVLPDIDEILETSA